MKLTKTFAALLALGAALLLGATPARAQSFELKDGDRVVLLGDTFIEREQQYGWIELMLTTKYEDLPMVVTRANDWIKSNAIQVINLETVYMPLGENGDGMVDERITGFAYRLLRVWYRA